MINRLTKENYLEVENYKNYIDSNIQTSAFSLLIWNFYGYDIFWEYFKKENIVLFYAKANKELRQIESQDLCDKLGKNYFIIYMYYKKEAIKLEDLIQFANDQLIKNFDAKNIIKIIGALDLNCYLNSNLKLAHDQLFQWYANFLYETQSLKTFAGKKLQKKRNNLNYFVREHSHDYVVLKFDHERDYEDVMNFFDEWNVKNFQNSYNMFVNANKFILEILKTAPTNHFVASCMRCIKTNKVVGFSVVYVYSEIAEILIEMADREIRGMYQFLLSQNIIINNITNQYLDRQDEAWSKNIAQSKLSYYPVVATTRVSIILK